MCSAKKHKILDIILLNLKENSKRDTLIVRECMKKLNLPI